MRVSPVVVAYAVLASLVGCSGSGDSGGANATESQVDAWVANDGYVRASELAPVATAGTFSSLADVPTGLADGDDTASEAEVDAFVANNGYALEASLAPVATAGSFASLTAIPPGLEDGDDTLTEAQVDAFVANDGYAHLAEVDTRLASLAQVARDGSFASLVDVPAGLADGDDVATYTAGAGLMLSGNTFSVAPDVVRRDGSGDVVVSGSYRYAAPRTASVWIPASAFQRRFQSQTAPHGLEIGTGYLHLVSTTIGYSAPYAVEFSAPAPLPHGGTVTAFTCFVYDTHPTGSVLNVNVALERTTFPFTVDGVGGILGITTSGTPGTVSYSAPSISNAVVDTNATYGVSLQWRVDAVSTVTQTLAFLGCRVTYEHGSAL